MTDEQVEKAHEAYSAFQWLLGAHDHIWLDRYWPLRIRIVASDLLWRKAIKDHEEKGRP